MCIWRIPDQCGRSLFGHSGVVWILHIAVGLGLFPPLSASKCGRPRISVYEGVPPLVSGPGNLACLYYVFMSKWVRFINWPRLFSRLGRRLGLHAKGCATGHCTHIPVGRIIWSCGFVPGEASIFGLSIARQILPSFVCDVLPVFAGVSRGGPRTSKYVNLPYVRMAPSL